MKCPNFGEVKYYIYIVAYICVTMEDFKASSVKWMATFEATFYFVGCTHGYRPIQRTNVAIVHQPMLTKDRTSVDAGTSDMPKVWNYRMACN
jgi:hypothetical protein